MAQIGVGTVADVDWNSVDTFVYTRIITAFGCFLLMCGLYGASVSEQTRGAGGLDSRVCT